MKTNPLDHRRRPFSISMNVYRQPVTQLNPCRMMKMLCKLVVIIILVMGGSHVSAQSKQVLITGRVLESSGDVPIEFASVAVKNKKDESLVTGTATDAEGRFEILCKHADVYVEVSFMGFIKKTISAFEEADGRVALGDILLEEDRKTLGEIVIEGERSQTEFHLDKRVFNVGQDLSSSGASALEVLNHVPSVKVNIEGKISLRGSQGVRILINGKPSVLASEQGNALGSITADMIEKIEVITSPSAKYDAEGTAGIINIVLKKEDAEGINGAVTVNTGVPNNHSLGFSLSRRTEKLHLFSQVGVGHRTFPEKSKTINQDLEEGTAIRSVGDRKKNETFYNLILGADYHLNSSNQISVSGHWAYEKETENGTIDFTSTDGQGVSLSEWQRSESTTAGNPKWQYDVQYEKKFSDNKEHRLLVTALGNFFGKDQRSRYAHALKSGMDPGTGDQRIGTEFKEAEYTFKADYTWPITEQWEFESGIQHQFNDLSNDYAVSNLVSEAWQNDPALTNIFEMDRHVSAGYAIGAYEGKKLGVKVGLRVENTRLSTFLRNTDGSDHQQYLNLFPSAHTSYKFTDKISFQLGYSRRIYRPGLWELNPFNNIQNNYIIETGNPELQPEFTDAIETVGIFEVNAVSINLGLYHRYTSDAIEEITTIKENVSVTKPMNVGVEKTTGVELNAKYLPVDWLSIAMDLNFNYLARTGAVEDQSFDFKTHQWESNITTKFKFPADIDLEVSGNYSSAYQTIQGRVSDIISADVGVRKKIVNGKFILNLSVRDVFASDIWETRLKQSGYSLYEWYKMGRFVTFGVSYGFGKGEAMEFSGQKMF